MTPLPGAVSGIEYFVGCPTGTAEQYFSDGALRWSVGLYRIHGYERGDIIPTLDLCLSHIEPPDRDAARNFWDGLSSTGKPTSICMSIRDLKGRAHKVLIFGDRILDGAEAIGRMILVVDLTRSIHSDTLQVANEAVTASAAGRAVIEQAKGVLMAFAGLNAAEAFDRITSYSRRTNGKVLIVAQEIIDCAVKLTPENQHQSREQAFLDLVVAH
ncbi:GAF and ANTAR domain-containing protein [Arthrobacter sp. SX1312]|uniref:GAF and ANTAR domain-containing protein n=1 Tax=Arthrobacter sp. SX1312 TaxID=2058896 RepID=UPI000CE4A02E|nr:GAF and ANTAR domain-containing protein [Arthrobacter sp. SX1312]